MARRTGAGLTHSPSRPRNLRRSARRPGPGNCRDQVISPRQSPPPPEQVERYDEPFRGPRASPALSGRTSQHRTPTTRISLTPYIFPIHHHISRDPKARPYAPAPYPACLPARPAGAPFLGGRTDSHHRTSSLAIALRLTDRSRREVSDPIALWRAHREPFASLDTRPPCRPSLSRPDRRRPGCGPGSRAVLVCDWHHTWVLPISNGDAIASASDPVR